MRDFWDRFSINWCRTFHSKISGPVRGSYRCVTCLRAYPVPWAKGEKFLRKEMSRESTRCAGVVVLALQKNLN
jgi:hypothetical protein